MIECNIDDMNTELFDYVMKRLFDEGALDVFLTNIMMKKNRPAVKLSVIAKAHDVDRLSEVIFRETTSIGIRKYPVGRETLEREIVRVSTDLGEINIKVAYLNGKSVNYAPEYEDVKNIATQKGVAAKEVYREVLKSFDKIHNNN